MLVQVRPLTGEVFHEEERDARTVGTVRPDLDS